LFQRFTLKLLQSCLGLMGLVLWTLLEASIASGTALQVSAQFKAPAQGILANNVVFWKKIYGEVDSTEGLIHDTKYTQIVYARLKVEKSRSRQKAQIQAAKELARILIRKLRKITPTEAEILPEQERAIYKAFSEIDDPLKFESALNYKRIRFQLGQRDKFEEGWRHAGRYLTAMEKIFKQNGMPSELTRLPYVESSFNLKARSKVGASGIWQFMKSTGKQFLKVTPDLDERNDPIRATEAAAKLLRLNYESLGNWPLAVTAYNHGRSSLVRAVHRVGSNDLEELIKHYKVRSFGFASTQFYSCLLAALATEEELNRTLGIENKDKPLEYFEVELASPLYFKSLDKLFQFPRVAVMDLNPALNPVHFRSGKPLPKQYRLRLPYEGLPRAISDEARIRIVESGLRQLAKHP